MARLWYGGTPADFVIAQGATADILNESGAPIDDGSGGTLQGSAVLLPHDATAFTAYTDAELTSSTDDLLDDTGQSIETVSQSTDFDTRGTIPRFQGPDGHEGPLWLSADGVTGYRLEPESDTLYARVGEVEGAVTGLELDDMANVDAEGKQDGDALRWNNATGQWEPSTPAGTGTVTSVNDKAPDGDGNVALAASDVGAASTSQVSAIAAVISTLQSRGYVNCAWTGSGYEPKPAGFNLAIRIGPTTPASQNADGDLYFQPEED